MERWTISTLTQYIHQLFDRDEVLQDVEVEGEISDFRVPRSGHAYFTLKDDKAQLRCIMWKSARLRITYDPQHGDRVIARGYVSVYDAGGQYQLYARSIRPAGAGDLHMQFEALKARLQAEGLFDPARKRLLPDRPRVLGVVTSPSTAALQDVLNVLKRRNPMMRVILSPAAVQGDQAPPQIVSALEALYRQAESLALDVIIVVRGGGSLEDLWCFNDERVARAIADSPIPVVSGVGHEIDFTLADFAADLRAPTPSAAAELVTPVTVDSLQLYLDTAQVELSGMVESTLREHRQSLEMLTRALDRLSPQGRVNDMRQTLDRLSSRADFATRNQLRLKRQQVDGMHKTLTAFNPKTTLARGYSIVYGPDGQVVRRGDQVKTGDLIRVKLHQGGLRASVEEHLDED